MTKRKAEAESQAPFLKVDTANHIVTFPGGLQLKIKPVNAFIVEFAYSNEIGKPQPPIVDVEYLGGVTKQEPNPFDKNYQQQLVNWEAGRVVRALRIVLLEGVVDNPPPEAASKFRTLFPGVSAEDIKYLWLSTLVRPEELRELGQLINEQSVLTEAGLRQAAATFPSNGGRE
jgi:hypothetical protein